MKLKIRIKEVKEETRELTVFEEALLGAVRPSTTRLYYPEFVDRCKNKLKELGLSEHEDDYMGGYGKPLIGTFRTETIRDATPDEVIAWHCIGIAKMCGVMEWCMDCPKSKEDFLCYRLGEARVAEEFLKNKEVILELVD